MQLGQGLRRGMPKRKDPEMWAVKWVWDAQAGASALALRTRWRWWGEGSSLSTPFLHPLDRALSRTNAWLKLSREGGGSNHSGEPNLCSSFGERLVPRERIDGVNSLCTAGAKITAKGGRRHLGKPSRNPDKSVTHMVQTTRSYAALLLSDTWASCHSPVTRNDDNRFGLRALFIHSAPARHC